jgi:hypothetical protein
MFVLFGSLALWWLPRYQRNVESGKAQLDPAMPSFKVMRRVAIGFIIFGLLSYVAQYFVGLEF